MRLTNNEMRAVLERAAEIQRDERDFELTDVVSAAEEAGLSRQAVERALSERLNISLTPPAVGEMAWAKSVDGKFYLAKVMSLSDDGVNVRFLRGSQHRVALNEVRPCSLVPGERVVVYWPWWGPWTCSVVSYDAAQMEVKLSDGWGDTKTFPISEVWVAPAKPPSSTARRRVYAKLIGAGVAVGAAIGAIATAILMRSV